MPMQGGITPSVSLSSEEFALFGKLGYALTRDHFGIKDNFEAIIDTRMGLAQGVEAAAEDRALRGTHLEHRCSPANGRGRGKNELCRQGSSCGFFAWTVRMTESRRSITSNPGSRRRARAHRQRAYWPGELHRANE